MRLAWSLCLLPREAALAAGVIREVSMSHRSKSLGNLGEGLVADFLAAHGYRLVDTNVRPIGGASRGELDIIAWDDPYLVFVEVKSRRSSVIEPVIPILAIDHRKRCQLIRLAEAYLANLQLDDVPIRFDVAEVLYSQSLPPVVTLHRGVFDASDT